MTFEAPHIDYAGISPVIALTAGLVVVLVGGCWRAGAQRIVVSILGFGTLAAAAGLCIWQWGESKDLVAGALRLDDLALAVTLIAIAAAHSASRSPGARSRSSGRSARPDTASSRRC